jgi:hypothetical protein
MAIQRIRQKKKDLTRLCAWPRPLQARSGGRHHKHERPGPAAPYKAIAHDLPALYHETYLRVIPRDPLRLFSFWEIASPPAPDGTPFLRLYETDTGKGDKIIGDFAVGKNARSQYIRVPCPGRRYRVEYGISASDRFLPLCSSNSVEGPAGQIRKARPLTNSNNRRQAAAEALINYSASMLPAAASPQGKAAAITTFAADL